MSAPAPTPERLTAGDDLPPLIVDEVFEAPPVPTPGPARDALAATLEARVDSAGTALAAALTGYLTRARAVLMSRLGGPRARKGTRWWEDKGGGVAVEVKAVDADYVLPARVIDEIEQAVRPVVTRLAADTAADTAHRLDAERVPVALDPVIDEVIAELLRVAQRHADTVREVIRDADASADTFEEMLEGIAQVYDKSGNRMLATGRGLAAGLLNHAALEQARAAGVTHAQWLSRRDEKVRRTHRRADGQVRELGARFRVGGFRLRFPGDPSGLPASWPEVANCRCGLLFARPDRTWTRDSRAVRRAAAPRFASLGVVDLIQAEGAAVTREAIVGYRALAQLPAAEAGQRIPIAAGVVLGLLAPAAFTMPVLMVLIPAGIAVTVTQGAVSLPFGGTLEVLASNATSLSTRLLIESPSGETPP